MKKLIRKFALVILLLLPLTILAATPGQQLTKLLKGVYAMQAGFTQIMYGGKGRILRKLNGNMAMQRPGKFRWQITSPGQQLMVADGKRLWIYDKNLKQATVEKQSKGIGKTPASLLSGSVDLLTNYFIVQYYKGSYFLRPRYNGSMFKIIQMKFSGNRLKLMVLRDNLGQRSRLSFYNVRINSRMSSSLFRFRPPKGVDVIRGK